jgi:hypothetical protein
LILDFEFDQHLESHKHVISIIMRFRDTGCYRSPIQDQSCRSPPRTQSTPLPAPDQPQPKATKNVRGKSLSQQQKMSSKGTKGKKPLKESVANLKLPLAMIHATQSL